MKMKLNVEEPLLELERALQNKNGTWEVLVLKFFENKEISDIFKMFCFYKIPYQQGEKRAQTVKKSYTFHDTKFEWWL